MNAKQLLMPILACMVVGGFWLTSVAAQPLEVPNDRAEPEVAAQDDSPNSTEGTDALPDPKSRKDAVDAEQVELERKFVELARQRFQVLIQQDQGKIQEAMKAMEREIEEGKATDELNCITRSLDELVKKHPGTTAAHSAQAMLNLSRNKVYAPDAKVPVTYYNPGPLPFTTPVTAVPTLTPGPSSKSVLK